MLFKISALIGLAAASPILTARQSTTSTTGSTVNVAVTALNVTSPDMYYVYPQHPDVSKPAVPHLHVETFTNLSQIEQVAVFRGIPADAQNCSLGWVQADKIDRVFLLRVSDPNAPSPGLSSVRQLSGFPNEEEGVSWNSIKEFDTADPEPLRGPDFTFWDDEVYETTAHGGGEVDCAETVYIKIALRDPLQKASLYMAQDEVNGLVLHYAVPPESGNSTIAV
jgi:hypothetical protein